MSLLAQEVGRYLTKNKKRCNISKSHLIISLHMARTISKLAARNSRDKRNESYTTPERSLKMTGLK